MEVWQGLALLSEAILQGQALLANSSQPSETLRLHVDKAVSSLRSLTSLLRALGAQVCRTLPHSSVCSFCKVGEGLCPGTLRRSSSPPPILPRIPSHSGVPDCSNLLFSPW